MIYLISRLVRLWYKVVLWSKNTWTRRHSFFGAPQAPYDKLSPTSRQRLEETTSWCQDVIVSKQPPGTSVWRPLTAIYLTSNRIRKWHKVVLWWEPCTNRDAHMEGAEILDPVGIILLGRPWHQAINLVLKAGQGVIVSLTIVRHRCQAVADWGYLSLPPTRQDLTQNLFYREDLGGGWGRTRTEASALQVIG